MISQHFADLVEVEPLIQLLRSIQIQQKKKPTQKLSQKSYYLEQNQSKQEFSQLQSEQSLFNSQESEFEKSKFIKSLTKMSTNQTINKRQLKSSQSIKINRFKNKMKEFSKIQSFRLQEWSDSDSNIEDKNSPQCFKDVNLKFRLDAIVSVNKIKESQKL